MKFVQLLCRICLLFMFVVVGAIMMIHQSTVTDNILIISASATILFIGYVCLPSFDDDEKGGE